MDQDLHRKMSKKIAQLTRVIYQLHVKTDDNELELQETADKYEAEIGQVWKTLFIVIFTYIICYFYSRIFFL